MVEAERSCVMTVFSHLEEVEKLGTGVSGPFLEAASLDPIPVPGRLHRPASHGPGHMCLDLFVRAERSLSTCAIRNLM